MSRTLTGPHLITTTPTATTCRHCRRPILAATIGGLDRHLDLVQLTPAGELAALLAGRATFTLRGDLLARRTVHHIRGGSPTPVLPEHACPGVDPTHVAADQAAVTALLRRLHNTHQLEEATDARPPF